MSTPKFSPGPWHIRFGGTSEDSGFTVADRDKRPVAEHWPAAMLPEERATINANARLVAASPDLYDACRAFLDRYDQLREQWGDEGFTRSLADRVRAAVKLADESRQPC